jgi:hypothetical protein
MNIDILSMDYLVKFNRTLSVDSDILKRRTSVFTKKQFQKK